MARGAGERSFEDIVNRDLKTHVYAPVYVFDGPDAFRMESVVERLRADALDPASAAFNAHVLDGDQASWRAVLQVAQGYPMLGARQFVRVRHAERMSSGAKDEDGAAVIDYFANPMTTTLLIITAEKLDRRKAWVKAAIERGYLAHFAAPSGDALKAWAAKAAARAKLEIDREAIEVLVALVGEDLQALMAEIDKLALLAQTWQRRPTAEDVLRVVMDQVALEVFALTDALEPGDPTGALTTWRRLNEWGEDANGVAPIAISHLRRTALISSMLRDGANVQEIVARTNLNAWMLKKMVDRARRYDAAGCDRLVDACLACERTLKRSPVAGSVAIERMLLAATLNHPKGES